MTVRRFKNQSGVEWALEVPGPGLDERTFAARVERGEYTLVADKPRPVRKLKSDTDAD